MKKQKIFKNILRLSLLLNCILVFLLIGTIVAERYSRNVAQELLDEVNTLYQYKQATTSLKSGNKEELEVCSTGEFKSFMPYRAITDKSSKQFELQQYATTENAYGLRMLDDYFMVAVTSQYGEVGDLLEIELESGWLLAIVGDIKSAGHDDCKSFQDNSVIEFIIDNNRLNEEIKYHGDLNILFKGEIKRIYNLGSYQ